MILRGFLPAVALIGVFLGAAFPVRADLGAADMPIDESGQVYNALCGKDEQDCRVAFKDGRLVVDSGAGISDSQVVRLTYEKIHTGDWLSTWHYHEYRVKYRTNSGSDSIGIIRFYNDGVSDEFKRRLEDWVGEPIRPVGPTVKIVE